MRTSTRHAFRSRLRIEINMQSSFKVVDIIGACSRLSVEYVFFPFPLSLVHQCSLRLLPNPTGTFSKMAPSDLHVKVYAIYDTNRYTISKSSISSKSPCCQPSLKKFTYLFLYFCRPKTFGDYDVEIKTNVCGVCSSGSRLGLNSA